MTDREREDQKIWHVTVNGVEHKHELNKYPPIDLTQLESELSDSLRAIEEFAKNKKMNDWADIFHLGIED